MCLYCDHRFGCSDLPCAGICSCSEVKLASTNLRSIRWRHHFLLGIRLKRTTSHNTQQTINNKQQSTHSTDHTTNRKQQTTYYIETQQTTNNTHNTQQTTNSQQQTTHSKQPLTNRTLRGPSPTHVTWRSNTASVGGTQGFIGHAVLCVAAV